MSFFLQQNFDIPNIDVIKKVLSTIAQSGGISGLF